MHGLGNSYVLFSDLDGKIGEEFGYSRLAKAISNKNYGIGSDGILVAQKEENLHVMRIFNPDGSEAEMCGNGVRMFSRFLYDEGRAKREIMVKTLAGTIETKINLEDDEFVSVTSNMGKGRILGSEKIEINDLFFEGTKVSVGNPHFVIFKDSASEEMAKKYGPIIEYHEVFQPNRTNIEFARIVNEALIDLHVWERGAGYTLACGTGASATAFAAERRGLVNRNLKVRLPGGDLEMFVREDDAVFMTGPAQYIFNGHIIDLERMLANFSS
jgi:diaminopimelate epimerase